jgi:hypothetical protein
MSKKIDASEWNKPYTYHEKTKEYSAKSSYYNKHSYQEHGRSQASTDCGFCGTDHTVYIWSFIGSGKRCTCCGAKMYLGISYAEADKVKNLKNP